MTGLDAGLVYNSFPKFADRNNVKYLHYGFEIDLCPLDYNRFLVIEWYHRQLSTNTKIKSLY